MAVIYALALLTFSRILPHSLAFSHSPASFLAFLARFFFLIPAVTNSQFLNFSICDIFTAFPSPSHSHFYCAKCPAAQLAAQQQRSSRAGHPRRILISLTVAVFPAIDYISSHFPLPLLLLLLLLLQLLLLLLL